MDDRARPLVSVIVPVYNTQELLPRCLDSILRQTYSNMELILINDGSTDESLSVCEKFDSGNARIQIINQPNQGIIAAKKAGIKVCKGDYVMFVDSDDWIEPELAEKMVHAMQEYDCSLVCTNVYTDFTDCIVERRNAILPGIYETDKIAKDLFYYKDTDCYGVLPYSVAKLYPRGMLKEVLVNIDDGIRYAEDKAIVFGFVFRNIKVCFADVMQYHYCVRNGSVCQSENPNYLVEVTAFYQYAKNLFEKHKEREYLFRQLGKYLLQEARLAVNKRLGLTTIEKPIYKPPYELDPSVFLTSKKKVILYGAGKVGADYQKKLEGCANIELCGWVDKNYDKYQDKSFAVKPVKYIQETKYDYILVAVLKRTVFNNIKNELTSIGIDKGTIIWGRPYGAPCEED